MYREERKYLQKYDIHRIFTINYLDNAPSNLSEKYVRKYLQKSKIAQIL